MRGEELILTVAASIKRQLTYSRKIGGGTVDAATKVDVGYWLGKRRLWACVAEQELLLFARGRRPYIERIPLAELRESLYNHATGELVLAPSKSAAVKALRVPPLPALEILAHMLRQIPEENVGHVLTT